MKKRLLSVIPVLAISFANAQLSFSDALRNMDSSLIILASVFIISFLIFNFSLSKFFKEQKKIAVAISAILSFLIIYGINSAGWNIENFFFDLGVSEDAFLTLIPLVLLAGLVFLYVRLGKNRKYFLYIIGGFLVAVGFFIFRDAAQILVTGIFLIILGFIIKPLWDFLRISFGMGQKQKTNYK